MVILDYHQEDYFSRDVKLAGEFDFLLINSMDSCTFSMLCWPFPDKDSSHLSDIVSL